MIGLDQITLANILKWLFYLRDYIIFPLSPFFSNGDSISIIFSKIVFFLCTLSVQFIGQVIEFVIPLIFQSFWKIVSVLFTLLVELLLRILTLFPLALFGITVFFKKIGYFFYNCLSITTERWKQLRLAAKLINDGFLPKFPLKNRINFNKKDIAILESCFAKYGSQKHLSENVLKTLCEQTNMTSDQITNWWYKRRFFSEKKYPQNESEKKKAKRIFNDFFKEKKYPNKEEISILKHKTGMQENFFSSYFAQQRFREKRRLEQRQC